MAGGEKTSPVTVMMSSNRDLILIHNVLQDNPPLDYSKKTRVEKKVYWAIE